MPKHKKHEETTLPATNFDNPGLRRTITNVNLAQLREMATTRRADTAQTIAELEAWCAEINATIAFLKAQRS